MMDTTPFVYAPLSPWKARVTGGVGAARFTHFADLKIPVLSS